MMQPPPISASEAAAAADFRLAAEPMAEGHGGGGWILSPNADWEKGGCGKILKYVYIYIYQEFWHYDIDIGIFR